MGKSLVFVGWERPVIHAIADWLLPAIPAEPPDFSRTLILVPTRQAGRRLRQALARRSAEGETGVLGLRVVTPAALLEPPAGQPDAPPMLVQAIWMLVLKAAALDAFPALLPVKLSDRSTRWALQTGALLQSLREQLAESGLAIADVPAKAGERLGEPERWRDLARLEAGYRAALATTGFEDPCIRKCGLPALAVQPAGIDTLILAGVPDPPDLVVTLLDRLAAVLEIKVLIHAPASEAGLFDDWGRPLADAWAARSVVIPDETKTLLLAADPGDQARRVLAELDAEAGRYGAADIAVGVPDPEVAAALSQALSERGVTAFDPAEPPLSLHPASRLLSLFQAFATAPAYRVVADLLRHDDVLRTLADRHRLSPRLLLTELDEYQNTFMPRDLHDFTDARLTGTEPVPDLRSTAFPTLQQAIRLLRAWRALITDSASPAEGMRLALQAVYSRRMLSEDRPRDREFTAAANEINEALSELDDVMARTGRLQRDEALELLAQSLAGRTLATERETADMDLEGWLELPWNPAPFLLVTGLNEGRVPDSRMGDVFLPDSLRAQLGLRHDSRRFARDLFLLETLIESRRRHGALRLLCGKTSAAGDPLKPSRLLFQCADADLPARAARLFEELPNPATMTPASISFQLQPGAPGLPALWPADKTVSVTAFRSYLECPFRFYLRFLLKMEAVDDLKTETDDMEFGQLVHYALQQLHLNGELRACADESRLLEALVDAADQWMRGRYGDAWSLPQRIVFEAARNRLAAAAKRQAAEAASGWIVLAAETTGRLTLGGLSIKGKIDRIDFNPGTNTVRILDYKTSALGKTCQQAHLANARDTAASYARVEVEKKWRQWIDLQLPLYALMWKAAPLNDAPNLQLGYFLLPPALEDTRVQVWDDLTPEMLDSARRCAEGVCQAIRKGSFWPPAERVMYDDFRDALGAELGDLFKPLAAGGAS
jgi:ATP-dependent helicase/nuclease subunit B